MPAIIRVLSWAAGDPVNQYLAEIKSVDDAYSWRFTNKLDDAMKFADFMMAYDFWQTQSLRRPFRSNGKPNRPLTAFNVLIESV